MGVEGERCLFVIYFVLRIVCIFGLVVLFVELACGFFCRRSCSCVWKVFSVVCGGWVGVARFFRRVVEEGEGLDFV